jgi:hydroxymethylbilane synthase
LKQNIIHIATRKSPLALKQTAAVLECLGEAMPDQCFESLELTTQVDQRLKWSLEKRGGIGLFTKELEEALLEGRADIAVHSAKDMPTTTPEGLAVAGYLPRARANDCLIRQKNCAEPALIATSSPRRRAQLGKRFPHAEWSTIRGNVGTRLKKIVDGACEASILAAAGLDRLEISQFEGLVFEMLSFEEMVPAPGQAAIAIQCREEALETYAHLFCERTKIAVSLEKGFLKRLGSGCQIPVGAYYHEDTFRIFHPETGYRAFNLDIQKSEDIEPALDRIFKDLQL